MRSSHIPLGALAGLAYGVHQGFPPAQSGACAVLAAAVAPLPDVDARRWWRTTDRVTPDEALGHGGPMRHRGLTHWWGVPVALAMGLSQVGLVVDGMDVTWVGWALLAGWCSHLAGDLVFGKRCPQEGRGPGIPLAPWWAHRGVGLDTGGVSEVLARWVVLVPALAWLAGVALGWATTWPVDAVAALR
jgi:hypothetical protein